jgi:hypothetical protein
MPRITRAERSKAQSERLREEGLETQRNVWIRKDVQAAVEVLQDEYKQKYGKRLTWKELTNTALFDLVLRKKLEIQHGHPIKYNHTSFDLEKGTFVKHDYE